MVDIALCSKYSEGLPEGRCLLESDLLMILISTFCFCFMGN